MREEAGKQSPDFSSTNAKMEMPPTVKTFKDYHLVKEKLKMY